MHTEVKERIKKAIQRATDLSPSDLKNAVDNVEKEIGEEWDSLEERWKKQDPKLLKWAFGVGGLVAGVVVGVILF